MCDEAWEPSDVQLVVGRYYEREGRWPLWIGVGVQLIDDYDWDDDEVDEAVNEAIRRNEVIPTLRGRWWVLELEPPTHDAVSLWDARQAQEEEAQ
jgi:ABC-type transport system substrate-binding protein